MPEGEMTIVINFEAIDPRPVKISPPQCELGKWENTCTCIVLAHAHMCMGIEMYMSFSLFFILLTGLPILN